MLQTQTRYNTSLNMEMPVRLTLPSYLASSDLRCVYGQGENGDESGTSMRHIPTIVWIIGAIVVLIVVLGAAGQFCANQKGKSDENTVCKIANAAATLLDSLAKASTGPLKYVYLIIGLIATFGSLIAAGLGALVKRLKKKSKNDDSPGGDDNIKPNEDGNDGNKDGGDGRDSHDSGNDNNDNNDNSNDNGGDGNGGEGGDGGI
jgi:hypothetical protein